MQPSRGSRPVAEAVPAAPEVPAAALCALLDRLAAGVILADAAAQPCYANAEACRILAEADGLRTCAGTLAALAAASTQRLRQAIALVATQGGTPASRREGIRLSLPRPAPRLPLLLTLYPLPTPAGCAALYITAPERLPPLDRDAIAEALHLTPREAALATLLADGHDLHDCARRLAISDGTARNHLKHVFEKTSLHSQTALVAQLRGFGEACRR
ncbi:helix-turn-helix transcriptional regulator [Frateuria defendens]|uniref:helix-turn-helix transcriptional regulator n=1 Tax=Frateuria defendens TaxID=2219559 RepID=UPI001379269F|nr:helix-turn-helix transcriptional regulator [Frateuria defendens]